nr:protein like COV 2 [Tanacetum cinerariifolium]
MGKDLHAWIDVSEKEARSEEGERCGKDAPWGGSYPRAGEYAFGFITSSFILQSDTGEEELYSVYVPTNHLYIGDIFL